MIQTFWVLVCFKMKELENFRVATATELLNYSSRVFSIWWCLLQIIVAWMDLKLFLTLLRCYNFCIQRLSVNNGDITWLKKGWILHGRIKVYYHSVIIILVVSKLVDLQLSVIMYYQQQMCTALFVVSMKHLMHFIVNWITFQHTIHMPWHVIYFEILYLLYCSLLSQMIYQAID